MAGTSSVSGLSSGFDWASMIDQLIEVDRAPITLVENQVSEYEEQLSAWQSFNTSLLALKTAADALSNPDDFNIYTSGMTSDSSTVDAEDLLSVSATSSASPGSYTIQINNIATAQKLSSASFSSYSDELGSSYSGEIIINGRVISISETDGLDDIRNRINNANSGTNPTGVTASIISYGENDYRLILTSSSTGADGISLQNGSSSDLVELFGWKDGASELKNSITGGALSDTFSSSTQSIQALLGLSTGQSGTVTINGQSLDIDLSADSLESIKTNINTTLTGVSASIVTNTEDGETTYALQIDGTQTFVDDQNILEAIGILTNGVSDVQGVTSSNEMTTNGDAITASALLTDIDGYYSWTSGDSITISGNGHTASTPVSDTFSITASSTVQDLLDQIKSAFFDDTGDNISLRITSDGTIEVEDLETGTSSLSLTLSSGVTDGTLDWGTFGAVETVRKRELIAGQDASLTIDGVEVTSKDNSVEDIIAGVTLNLVKADAETTVTLNIERDLSAIEEKIRTFVDAYNEVASFISEQQAYDEENETTGGILFGDGTLSSVKSDLTSILVQSVWGVSSEFSILGLAGINLDNEGQLTLDSEVLQGYLETNFYDIQQLFAATGSSDSGAIEYISSTNDTEAGEYTVNITQAASQSSSTSSNLSGGVLSSDETLTITDGDNVAAISLTSGMTISDIVNAVNTELDTVYTETLAGANAVTSDGATPVTSTTAWNSVNGANLQDDDVISFTGTARDGSSISSSYMIDDISTDMIQGLLSEIESAFSDDVTASIDSTGHIVLTDNYEGASSLTLSFDYTETTGQVDIFGTVSTEQEGRYAMAITASNSSDQLKLTSDSYGSGYNFTIESTGTGLWSGSATADNGLDVAGTINGEAATGKGQYLTGDDGEANIDGLVIKYSGSTTGTIGNIKFTVGAAELFDRALFNITDSYEGYVAFKQDSLSERISDLEDRIEQMEARLEQKRETLTARYTAMEMALSKMQSMNTWLTSQLSALNG
ncbi:MAG: flagellar filament capping protein FliD [Deltaproteobacteria bacterium]|nr:flagellar filament capping protein FliD [Deltaproteobacteria bacterium]